MWQDLQTKKTSPVMDIDILLPDKLNNFFARFEDNTEPPTRSATKDCGLSFSVAGVSKTFKRANPRKAAGPDGIPSCVGHNQSLSQSAVPTCFKMATIVPVPKKAKVTERNYYHPVALLSSRSALRDESRIISPPPYLTP
jgi:hypothetical protein